MHNARAPALARFGRLPLNLVAAVPTAAPNKSGQLAPQQLPALGRLLQYKRIKCVASPKWRTRRNDPVLALGMQVAGRQQDGSAQAEYLVKQWLHNSCAVVVMADR